MDHKVSKWPYTAALQWHQLLELTASEERSAFPSRACSNSSLVSRQLRMCKPRLVELHAKDAVTLWAFKKQPRIPAKRLCKYKYKDCFIFLAYSQSRCFFFGPLTSCVVALQRALLMADPVMLCWAAAMRSVMDCPDIFIQLWDTKNQH